MKEADNFGLSKNALKIFETLYSLTGETINETFERVSKEFSTNEEEHKLAYDLLYNNIWRPNTPVWLNAGTKHKVFSACYVGSLEDSMDSIYNTANIARKIFQYGAGIGIPIGNLREKEAYIYEGEKEKPPEGKSSGPITFMKLYDAVGETTKSGGRVRRAAILCGMPIWHPNIMDFISCKEIDGRLANMNISVNITDKFMESLKDNIPFVLVSPYDGKEIEKIDPQEVWDKISFMSWKTAEPGVLFIDTIQKFNILKKHILIESPNPCVTGDTLVTVKSGDKKITSLSLNDKVMSYNEEKGVTEWDEVINISKTRENTDVIRIELEDGEFLELTPDHPVYTENRGYEKASLLTEKDILLYLEE